MRKLTIFAITAMIFSIAALGVTVYAQGSPPEVVCVPTSAQNPAVPHDTWSGLETTQKGTAHDPDGDATLATYEWDFDDGSPAASGALKRPLSSTQPPVPIGSTRHSSRPRDSSIG